MNKIMCVGVMIGCLALCACAVKPDDNYQLTPAEMKMAGSAEVTKNENVQQVYNNAEFSK
jgi:hypothetical protein